jgi:hypothetical protein
MSRVSEYLAKVQEAEDAKARITEGVQVQAGVQVLVDSRGPLLQIDSPLPFARALDTAQYIIETCADDPVAWLKDTADRLSRPPTPVPDPTPIEEPPIVEGDRVRPR